MLYVGAVLTYLRELSGEAIDLWDLGRVRDRDHIRSKAYQLSIFPVELYVYVMRSIGQDPRDARQIRKSGEKRPWDTAEEEVGMETP